MAGWSLAAGLDHSFGHALLTPGGGWLGAAVGSLGVQPRLNFRGPAGVRLMASASASVSFEYTPPGNPTGRRFDWSDLRLGLNAPAVWRQPAWGLALTPGLSVTLPTSLRSQWAGTLGVLSAGLGLTRAHGPWQLSLQVNGARGLHRTQAVGPQAPAPGAPLRRDADGRPLYLLRAGEQLGVGPGLNTAWTLSHALGALYLPTDALFLSARAGLTHAWAYDADPLRTPGTAPARNTDGDAVVRPGMGRRDVLSLGLGAGVALGPSLSLSLGADHAGAPLTGTQQGLRVADPASWLSSLTYSLSLSALL
jgi:hypothetical protein